MSVKSEDPSKSEISTVFGRCRCCLEYGYMKNMWKEHYANGDREIYGEMLMETFSIAWDVSTDSKSHICEPCVVRLRDAFNFKKEVLASEQLLQDDSDGEYEMDDGQEDAIWYKFEEDGESAEGEEEEYEEERLEEDEEDTMMKTEPVEYEEVEYLEEYAQEVEGASKKAEPAAAPASKTKWPRKKKPEEITRPYKNYSSENMRKALEAVKDGKMSISDASKEFRVPRKTVTAKLHSLKNKRPGDEPEATRLRAREALNQKRYRYLGGDLVHKHKQNVQSLFKWSNATPISGHAKDGFRCYFCKKSFKLAKQLKVHSTSTHRLTLAKLHARHTLQWTIRIDITDLKCNICDEEQTRIEDLFEHLKTHDKIVHTDVKNQIIPFSFPNNKFACMICKRSFSCFKPLTYHMIEHYKIYECADCGKGFVSKKNLSRHVSRHRMGDYRCSYCEKEFGNRELVMAHERLRHKRSDGRRKGSLKDDLECNICQKRMPTELQLSQHIKKVHLKEKRFYCEHCDKGFYVKADMEDHMVIHTREKRFRCMVCPRAYARHRALVEHLRVHADDRRFRCEQCGQTFVRAQTLKQHEVAWHGTVD